MTRHVLHIAVSCAISLAVAMCTVPYVYVAVRVPVQRVCSTLRDLPRGPINQSVSNVSFGCFRVCGLHWPEHDYPD
jgi:hypothetical protein